MEAAERRGARAGIPIARPALLARVIGRRRPILVVFVAAYALYVLAALPFTLVQDSWLTLVSGREIVHHGLPWHDHLTVWMHGGRWIDQQWLAQLIFYGLVVAGGIKLALLFHAALAVSAMALAVYFARRGGASREAVFVSGLAATWLAPWGLQLRAQSFATPLFILVLGLLVADSRAPSRRVYWVLPLLALWGNLHGTVVLGTALVALRGTLALAEGVTGHAHGPWKVRAGLLMSAPLCLLASPYGSAVVGYYRLMLVNPEFGKFVQEWRPSAPGATTLPFYVAAFVVVWLLGRHGMKATWFERVALIALLMAALAAGRSIVWFALAAVVIVPRLLDMADSGRSGRSFPLLWNGMAVAIVTGAAAMLVVTIARPERWFLRAWPSRAAVAVSSSLPARSSTVFPDDRYADWLLWEQPSLRGRVAYDVRFELMAPAQLARLVAFHRRTGDDWRRAARGADVLVFDPRDESAALKEILSERGARIVYRTPVIAVVRRARPQKEGSTAGAAEPMLRKTGFIRQTAANAIGSEHSCVRGCHGLAHGRGIHDLRAEPAGAGAPAGSLLDHADTRGALRPSPEREAQRWPDGPHSSM